jgi:hypothetical protein
MRRESSAEGAERQDHDRQLRSGGTAQRRIGLLIPNRSRAVPVLPRCLGATMVADGCSLTTEATRNAPTADQERPDTVSPLPEMFVVLAV